jgi:hypothetical protein
LQKETDDREIVGNRAPGKRDRADITLHGP